MPTARIGLDASGWWFADCVELRAYTQGTSREDAMDMLADCIAALTDRPDLNVTVTELARTEVSSMVRIDANRPDILRAASERQRGRRRDPRLA